MLDIKLGDSADSSGSDGALKPILNYHLIVKLNGIAHEYAWLDKHPDVCLMRS